MIANWNQKLELVFWQVAIPAMSGNRIIRKAIKLGYDLYHNKELLKAAGIISLGGLAGGMCGVLLFFVIQAL